MEEGKLGGNRRGGSSAEICRMEVAERLFSVKALEERKRASSSNRSEGTSGEKECSSMEITKMKAVGIFSRSKGGFQERSWGSLLAFAVFVFCYHFGCPVPGKNCVWRNRG